MLQFITCVIFVTGAANVHVRSKRFEPHLYRTLRTFCERARARSCGPDIFSFADLFNELYFCFHF